MNPNTEFQEKKEKGISPLLLGGCLIIIALVVFILQIWGMFQSGSLKDILPNLQIMKQETRIPEEATKQKMLELTNEQVHRGDLILVNADHGYDFDANEEEIDLVRIKEKQSAAYPVGQEEFQLSSHVLPYLDQMISDCNDAVTETTGVSSAFRSYDYQQDLWDHYLDEYGTEYTEKYVAHPGNSEHHTGLAVDLSVFSADGEEGSFSESENAKWVAQNCQDYGFVRRYAEDKVDLTGISNEAWHFRYVGLPHAVYMKKKNLALEEYIGEVRQYSEEHPLTITTEKGNYLVYFTTSTYIKEPEGDYTLSGNNIDGFILTVKVH